MFTHTRTETRPHPFALDPKTTALLTVDDAAQFLRLSTTALRAMVQRGIGPPVTRLGRRRSLRFESRKLLQWVEEKGAAA